MINFKSLIKKIFFILVFIAVVIALFIHFDLYIYFCDKEKTLKLLERSSPLDIPIFIFLQALQVIMAPLPGEITGIVGGVKYGVTLGTLFSLIGLTIGSWMAFLMARYFGMPFLIKVVDQKIINKYYDLVNQQGRGVTFLLFFLPGFPKDYLSYIMGTSKISVWSFLLISTAGRLFGTVMLSLFGSYTFQQRYWTLLFYFFFTSVLFSIGFFYRKKLLFFFTKKK